MRTLDFARLNKQKYPNSDYLAQEDQSAGFVDARRIQSGTIRGTLTVVNTDGSKVTIGVIPNSNNQFGLAFFDKNGTLSTKHVGATRYIYKNGFNIIQDGLLPDNSGGFIIVKDGINVADVF